MDLVTLRLKRGSDGRYAETVDLHTPAPGRNTVGLQLIVNNCDQDVFHLAEYQ